LATAAHSASAAAAASSGDALTCAFLDADMSVLGRDPAGYDEYAGQIRAEYSFVERGTYCKKRAEVLRSFLPGEGAAHLRHARGEGDVGGEGPREPEEGDRHAGPGDDTPRGVNEADGRRFGAWGGGSRGHA
ncbi:hypothetical protein THAOC_27290, partial [Thalassiosira oceanica]